MWRKYRWDVCESVWECNIDYEREWGRWESMRKVRECERNCEIIWKVVDCYRVWEIVRLSESIKEVRSFECEIVWECNKMRVKDSERMWKCVSLFGYT